MASVNSVLPILREMPDQIHTARLTIRSPRPGDGPRVFAAVEESLAELRMFPASLRWALGEPSVEASEQYCREAYANFVTRRDLPFLVLLRDSSTIVASSGLHRIDWTVPKFEVGFWGRTSFQRNGYVTEAVGAIVAMAFDRLGARRVEARTDELNDRSWRICERLGFKLEGTLRHERVDPDGRVRDTRIYAQVR